MKNYLKEKIFIKYAQNIYVTRLKLYYLSIYLIMFFVLSLIAVIYNGFSGNLFKMPGMFIMVCIIPFFLILLLSGKEKLFKVSFVSALTLLITIGMVFGYKTGSPNGPLLFFVIVFILLVQKKAIYFSIIYSIILSFIYYLIMYLQGKPVSFDVMIFQSTFLICSVFFLYFIADMFFKDVEEKNQLVKEIQHRVGNNLQLLLGYCNLYRKQRDEIDIDTFINAVHNKIEVMSFAHSCIDLGTYPSSELPLGILFENIKLYFVSRYPDISFDFKVINQNISLEMAVPLIVLISEILSNSCMHGDYSKSRGKISLIMGEKDNMFQLHLSDNGHGDSRNIDFENPRNTGTLVISMLVDQLFGKVTVATEEGMVYDIQFPKSIS